MLNAAAQRAEQGGGGQGGGGHGDRAVHGEHPGGQQHQPGVDPDEQAGDDRVGQGAADDPVDLIQPVAQYGHAHAQWERHAGGIEGDGVHHAGHPRAAVRLSHCQDHDADEADRRSGGEPLVLFPDVTLRAPEAGHLADDPGHPEEELREASSWRSDEMAGHHGRQVARACHIGRRDGLRDQHQDADGQVGPQCAAPRPGQPAVREQQDRCHAGEHRHRPEGVLAEEHSRPEWQ